MLCCVSVWLSCQSKRVEGQQNLWGKKKRKIYFVVLSSAPAFAQVDQDKDAILDAFIYCENSKGQGHVYFGAVKYIFLFLFLLHWNTHVEMMRDTVTLAPTPVSVLVRPFVGQWDIFRFFFYLSVCSTLSTSSEGMANTVFDMEDPAKKNKQTPRTYRTLV